MKRITFAALLLLAACSGGEGEEGNNSSSAGQVVEQTPSNLQDDPNNSVVPLTPPPAQPLGQPAPAASPIAALPPEFQGRWGMVANDCTPGRADAKGLMTVGTDGLRFYESRARIESARSPRPGSVELDLAFTGEGQEWNRTETLTILDGGRTLTREEQKPAGSFRYIRCPAGTTAA